MKLDPHIPSGSLAEKWDNHRFEMKLVNPANKRKFRILVVGTGLAGGSAAAALAELGYNVESFCFQDSPRRAHSIAAQGGINAAKNYPNDGDSVRRLFYDTIKGGDFRSREANVYRLAQVSVHIIDQCVAQGVPFAREYGGLLFNRSFGGAQVSRTFYCRGQTGQQLLLGAYQAMSRQIAAGRITMHPRTEMLDLVVVDGRARGIVVRDLATGADSIVHRRRRRAGDGRLQSGVLPVDQRQGLQCDGHLSRLQARGGLRQPLLHADSSDLHPRQRRSPEQADAHVGIAAQRRPYLGAQGCRRSPLAQPGSRRASAITTSNASTPASATSLRATSLRGPPRKRATTDAASARADAASTSTSPTRFAGWVSTLSASATATCSTCIITSPARTPYKAPMRIYPAPHYTMGGLWVDYNLMSNIPGLFVIGEANFSDHGANRLGASALMQGLADGYFVLPYTLSNYLASTKQTPAPVEGAEFKRCEAEVNARNKRLLSIKGKRSAQSIHRQLGKLMWDQCGMARSEQSLKKALNEVPAIRDEFWHNVSVTGGEEEMNQELEYAGRVADFLEFAELLCHDALDRDESCGAHFRIEHQMPDGEARRNDEKFSYVSAWEYTGEDKAPVLHKEPLEFEEVHLSVRSYK